ncbi:response regulator transcription factor [Spirochaeta isovalerica]|uniref:LuxR family transcriptional regulator of csgAB operon n=1 Tax=Spirochaeta isovalerica TaxID=150 RepID=A0A841R5Y5_9SPIO|nr:response regulator transcription factor [Spirochaeta isovalerica]MBB6479243.1 LuxR family transcriptional regulator of csgAB operon [Spirochaeta isovalerica]
MAIDSNTYPNTRVFIIGPLTLQNEFLLYVIKKEIGIECTIYDQELNSFPANLKIDNITYDEKMLILIDSEHQSFEEIQKSIVTNEKLSKCLIALFNLHESAGVEKKALARRIRGFFYKDDHFEVFLKGIRFILNGEIWISREILLKYVFDSLEEKQDAIAEKTSLTPREIEILTLVSMGSSNEEISNKICISTNTVKTHMYNIFKKINVQNRLQAALWAATNL